MLDGNKRIGTHAMLVFFVVLFIIICILISALCFPIHLLELGEEVGWRGYLLWFQVEKYGARKAVLVNGLEWGLAHMPLIYLGFNIGIMKIIQ